MSENTTFIESQSEIEIAKQKNEVVFEADSISVTDKPSYNYAHEFLINIKGVQKNIENYWDEPKRRANEAWKSICEKEKQMLAPLKSAESVVKSKMKAYADEQARIEQEIQRAREEARKAEADRLMREAADAEKNGNALEAETFMNLAQNMEQAKSFIGNSKQTGTRENKMLKIVSEQSVPDYVNGICIRPVDMTAVKKLFQLTGKLPDGIILTTETVIVSR